MLSSCKGCRDKDTGSIDSYAINTPKDFPLKQLDAFDKVFESRFRPGQGLKTGTYEVVQCPIDTSSLHMERAVATEAGLTKVTYTIAEDYSSLKSQMGLNVSLNAKMGWFSMESSLNKLESSFQNSFSTCLIAKVEVTNETKRIIRPKLFPEAEKLLLKDPSKFYTNYGDRFISGIITGGELYIVYEFLATSFEEKKELTAHIKASASNLGSSVEAVVDYTQKVEANKANRKVKVQIFRIGDKSNLPDNNIPAMLEYIQSFPGKVSPLTNEAFLSYVTEKYTAAGWTQPLSDKQISLDSLADLQRKIYQLLSWRQEHISQAIRNVDFSLDSTYWLITSNQRSLLLEQKDKLRKLYENLNSCYVTCSNINNCEPCKKMINEEVFSPDFSSFTSTKKYSYNDLVANTEINHYENTLCKLEPNSKYKLQFQGMLLAPGNIPFEAFVSPENDSRAVAFNSLGVNIVAYPIIYIKKFENGVMTPIPLKIGDREMEIETKNSEVVIMGATRYYVPSNKDISTNQPIYITPAAGWSWPSVKVYKWKKEG